MAKKPTRAQLEAARDRTIHDVIGPGLAVLFCGINPSLYSAATGRHFARPGNRFWPALHKAGFTPQQLSPFEDEKLLDYGAGVTNLVDRATARADELSKDELRRGAVLLQAKLERYRPKVLAIVGITAYRDGFEKRDAQIGEQPEPIGPTRVWALPNPSGLNAHYQLDDLAALYAQLRQTAMGK